jgi:glycosyltransferase involved in cell wall biosynthesis
MNVSISCITPVYNGERFLSETVASVWAQSYPLSEVIIVDDGSTDGTRALAEELIATYGPRLRYLWKQNGGAASARNVGIQAATGEFVTFIDADDLWHPERLALQVARFEARPELGFSVAHIQNFWMDEVRDEEERTQDQARAQPMAGYVATSLMARRLLFEQVGLFNDSLRHADSADWFLRAQEEKVIGELLPDVLIYRRMHRDNNSRLYAENSRAEFLRVLHQARLRQRARAAVAQANDSPVAAQD